MCELTPEEAAVWTEEMQRIIVGLVCDLVKTADKHNIDRDSAVQYFSELFSLISEISTFVNFQKEQPADVAPMAHGQWVSDEGDVLFHCSTGRTKKESGIRRSDDD